ncbi:dicarboxylate/amino acid:cation symporter [Acetomicrobium thermoterrenum]|uniref:dicarboxylate/amino acid:cation symporter n=1 Tax=Acetomicrobium thermoterrenum TaxID=1120986 RepID=UPI0022863B1A|nr:cation:dicarboxylase symporter family transporter [Acetomicrobium thermoterrenum]
MTQEEKLGIPRSVCGFTLPLGSQINLDGEAYYQVLSIFFVANAMGIHFALAQQVLLAIVVTIGTTGTAGIAGSSPVMLLAAMNMLGINPEPAAAAAAAFALVLGIDVILDMGRTGINVTGDLVGTTIVSKSEGLIDWERWK